MAFNSRQLQKEQTRRGILEAARAQFIARGYEQTTTRQIAEAAGVGTGTVFAHFADKHQLVRALLLQDVDDILVKAREGLGDDIGAVGALLHYARPLCAYYLQQPELSKAALANLMFSAQDYESQFGAFIVELAQRLAADAPQLPSVDRPLLATCLMANYFLVLLNGLATPGSTAESLVAQLEAASRLLVRPYGQA